MGLSCAGTMGSGLCTISAHRHGAPPPPMALGRVMKNERTFWVLTFAHQRKVNLTQAIGDHLIASQANEAPYGVAVHGTLARRLGATAEVIAAARTGQPIADPKLEALQQFTRALILGRTQVSDADVNHLLAAGFDRRAIVSIALGVAAKFFANAMAHLAQPTVDAGFASALPN